MARQALPADSPAQVYNEAPGVRTFPTEPPAMFFSFRANGIASADPARLLASIRQARSARAAATPEQLLAFEMYNASFGIGAPGARLVCLMMAVEVLIKQQRRSDAEQAIVREAISRAEQLDMDLNARQSFVGSLTHLLDESVATAGRRLARSLGELTYMDDESAEIPAGTVTPLC